MFGSWVTSTRLMSSKVKIALVPSNPLAPLIGSVETRRTPLPIRAAVRFELASVDHRRRRLAAWARHHALERRHVDERGLLDGAAAIRFQFHQRRAVEAAVEA